MPPPPTGTMRNTLLGGVNAPAALRKLGLQHSRINLRSHLAFIDKSKL